MSIEKDLRKIESRMIQEYFQDGIIELFLGLAFFWLWIFELLKIETGYDLLNYFIVILPIVFMNLTTNFARKKLVFPRTGYVNQEKYGKRQVVQAVLLAILALVLIFTIVWILQIKDGPLYPFFNKNISFILAFASAVYLALAAKISTVKRLYLYAIATALIFIVAGFVTFDVTCYILYFSLVLIFSGACLLIRFLRTHSVLEIINEEI